MKLMDHLSWNDVTDENLNFYKATGVDCVLVWLPPEMADGTDRTEEFKQMRKFVEAHGLGGFRRRSAVPPAGSRPRRVVATN